MQTKYRDIIDRYVKAYNSFEIDAMLADMHPDIRFTNISEGEVNITTNGLEEFRAQAEQAKQFFAERNQQVVEIRFDGDEAEVDISYTAILAMDFPDGSKAGDKLDMKGRSVFRFKDDKIISLTDIS